MRNLLSAGLKDNPALEKGVLTGILRVAKESIFSGLNNLTVHTLLDRPYAAHFGFTEAEVARLLDTYHLVDRTGDFQRWYNGYRMGELMVYNPWSALNALKQGGTEFAVYWANSAASRAVAGPDPTGCTQCGGSCELTGGSSTRTGDR